MKPKHWSDNLDPNLFDPSKVSKPILNVIKAAALIEGNGAAYGDYLKIVFPEADTQEKVALWSWEEEMHGKVLADWMKLADPAFDYDKALAKFREIYKPHEGAQSSVRGSPGLEMLSRCVVETGTSSFYSGLARESQEPLLQKISTMIAKDEIKHYSLFLSEWKMRNAKEKNSLWAQIKLLYGRITEVEDEEFAAAYFAANHRPGEKFDPVMHAKAYHQVAFTVYGVKEGTLIGQLILNAIGVRLPKWFMNFLGRRISAFMQARAQKLRNDLIAAQLPVLELDNDELPANA